VVTRRISWRGDDAWVKISDRAKTALTDDSFALTSVAEYSAPGMGRSADGIGYPGSRSAGM
jgi:hypothetical protein